MKHLIFTASGLMNDKGFENHFESRLMDLSKGIQYGLNPENFVQDLGTIQSSVTRQPHLKTLFFHRLWADCLLTPPSAAFIRESLEAYCPWAKAFETDLPSPGTGRWIKIPVLVARNRSARVVWFIAGLVPWASSDLFIPPWARKLMDKRFQESISSAEQWARRSSRDVSDRRFVVFPLAVDSGMVQFTGGSAALALGLGMKSLADDLPLSPDVIATGCLSSHGCVKSVGHLDQKTSGASEQKFKCLLHPAQSTPSQALTKQMNCYAVSRFDMAWTLSRLYSDQHARNLHDFTLALDDAGRFIDKMAHFPDPWLGYQQSAVGNILTTVFEDIALFGRFARTFSNIVRNYSLHDAALALTEFAPDQVPGQWPMAALVWCTANLALANHRGRTTRAKYWAQQGKKMADPAMTLDADLAVEFFNTLLVNAHNRFEFSMKLPGSLERLLGLLETRHTVMAKSGCVIDQPLGRLYGTLAQNTAFCGPQHIGDTEKWSAKARQALGENSSPELEPEWMRQYSYLGLARLCAGNMAGARTCLFKYLGVEDIGQIASKVLHLDAWQINMLARFLTSEGVPATEPLYTGLLSHVQKQISGHPWQLICFNLGRTALLRHDKKKARALFEQSLDICLAPNFGPAIRIMMLKPLAFLQDLVPACDFNQNTDHWQTLAKKAAAQLNPGGFAFLHDRSFSSVLDHVRRQHDQIFPFSYQ